MKNGRTHPGSWRRSHAVDKPASLLGQMPNTGRATLPEDFPPVVYVPRSESDDPQQSRVMLRTTADGRVALLAYSALDRFHEGVGAEVPWVLVTIEDLQQIYEQSPYELLLMDVRVPQESRRGPWHVG